MEGCFFVVILNGLFRKGIAHSHLFFVPWVRLKVKPLEADVLRELINPASPGVAALELP